MSRVRWTVVLAFALGAVGVALAFVPGLGIPAIAVCAAGIISAIIAVFDVN